METLVLSFILLVLAILGLALGVIAGRAPIRGSCGGITCQLRTRCGACNRGIDPEARR